MMVRSLLMTVGLVASTAAFAQGAAPQAAQNKSNWDIFQKLYPPRAIKAREEGAVGFKVTIDKKGLVTDCQVTQSSGHPLLDQETCKIIAQNAEFQPEEGLSASQVRTREGIITWKLPDSQTALNAPQAVAPNAASEKMVCKKTVRTGTIGATERTCMTQSQWARMSDEERTAWQATQGQGFTSGK